MREKGIENRNFYRLDAGKVFEFRLKGKSLNGIVLNISAGGAYVVTKSEIQIKDILKLNLGVFEGLEGLVIESEVVRVTYDKYYYVGVKFINISQIDRDKVVSYINKVQLERRRKLKVI